MSDSVVVAEKPMNKAGRPAASRSWRRVSRALQKRAVGLHAVKSEGMFPYETHYVLATNEEVERLASGTAMDEHLCGYGITK